MPETEKRGRGRPIKPHGRLDLRLAAEQLIKLKSRAERAGKTPSALAKEFIKQGLQQPEPVHYKNKVDKYRVLAQ